ncbi:MAG: aldehyde ferredoxin oxidoreductase [Desulfurococcales archaeon ex4484_42]|nr:MAG: aldehyde ferredoxin oxidoreductase [Desulfurococcales archaeon ex4484_42]
MYGWLGKILRIDLTSGKASEYKYDETLAIKFLGGRGFAIKLLWDLVKPGTPPLSPENKLIIMLGPLTGLPLPSSGKAVIASKSPLTHGYGDGNIGTRFSVNLRMAGYDGIIIEGKAPKPSVIYIEGSKCQILPADHLWGLTTDITEERLKKEFGKEVGVLTIGPAGENLVKISTVISEFGRAGGRPGMGAVMGSKNVKAIVARGTEEIPLKDKKTLIEEASKGYEEIKKSKGYEFWLRQGTMMTVEWAQANSVLPTHNFREGIFEGAKGIDGYRMEKMKVAQKGCPNCNMPCGNIVEFTIDSEELRAELDYENVAMLGSNIGIDDLTKVSYLNLLADKLGLDTISLGSVIGFAMELSERGLIEESIEWGDFKTAKELTENIAYRRGLGDLLAEGVKAASEHVGKGSGKFAMHVKGLEISAYDCHAAPGMALAYGTSPIGAHHKDAWFISLEIKMGRFEYTREKVEKLVWMQNIRGGLFEALTTCRLPWIELGFNLDNYLKFLYYATGVKFTWEEIYEVANRIYTLIRSFWVREFVAEGKEWSKRMDYPPARWFEEPLTKGPLKGSKLDYGGYDEMLMWYYELRGWDERGIPRKATLSRLGLDYVINELSKYVTLSG